MPKPEIAQIEVSTKCQLNCLMCPKLHFKNEWISKNMDMEIFQEVPFKKLKYVHLQGWGEPLLNPSIGEMIEIARKHCNVGLTTNGILIDKYLEELLQLDLLAVSIASADPKTHFSIRKCSLEKLKESIKLISEQRRKKPKIVVATIMLKNTIDQLSDIVNLAAECGADEVIANNLDYIPSENIAGMEVFSNNPDPKIEESIRKAQEKADNLGIGFIAKPIKLEEALVCAENPIKSCLIAFDGKIAPCVYLHLPTTSNYITRYFMGRKIEVPKLYFGHVKNFNRVWKSKNYRQFRETFEKRLQIYHLSIPILSDIPPLPEVCRTCYKSWSV